MPITREAFVVRNPRDEDDLASESIEVLDVDSVASNADPSGIVDADEREPAEELKDESAARGFEGTRAQESPQAEAKEALQNLPPADTTSAEKKEAVGVAHLQREARRSVANGRDVPQFMPHAQERERMEFNWDEARAQSEVYERRARAQKDAATEHLGRIHDIVGLLMDMSEAHSVVATTKLQSLERKIAELETRFSVNRLSQ